MQACMRVEIIIGAQLFDVIACKESRDREITLNAGVWCFTYLPVFCLLIGRLFSIADRVLILFIRYFGTFSFDYFIFSFAL